MVAERTMPSKPYGTEKVSPMPVEHHNVACSNLTRIFVYVNEEDEVVKSIFCGMLDNVFKRKRILYMCFHCGMMKEKRKECFAWGKRSFQRPVSILEKRKGRWHSYWVFLLKPYKALSRGGGISQVILNVKSFFFWPLKSRPLRKKGPVG